MSIFRGNICFLHSLSSTSETPPPPHIIPFTSFPLPFTALPRCAVFKQMKFIVNG